MVEKNGDRKSRVKRLQDDVCSVVSEMYEDLASHGEKQRPGGKGTGCELNCLPMGLVPCPLWFFVLFWIADEADYEKSSHFIKIEEEGGRGR